MRFERGRNRGATLLEVAVTLVVLGIGLLGLVRLQGLAREQLFDAAQRTTATTLARDVLTSIRENRLALADYQALGGIAHRPGAELGVDCAARICSVSERVAFDAYHWGKRLGGRPYARSDTAGLRADGGLVNGQICIAHDAGLIGVEVVWRGSVQGGTGTVTGEGSGDESVAFPVLGTACGEGAESDGYSAGTRRAVRMVSHVGAL